MCGFNCTSAAPSEARARDKQDLLSAAPSDGWQGPVPLLGTQPVLFVQFPIFQVHGELSKLHRSAKMSYK